MTGSMDGIHKSLAERAVEHKEIQDIVICYAGIHHCVGCGVLFLPVWRVKGDSLFRSILVADNHRLDRLREQKNTQCHCSFPSCCEDAPTCSGMSDLQGLLEKHFVEQYRWIASERWHVSGMLSLCPGRDRGRRCKAFRNVGLLYGERCSLYRDFSNCLDCGIVQHHCIAAKEDRPETGDTVCSFYFDGNINYHDVRSIKADYEKKSDFIFLRPVRSFLVYGDFRRSK